jgi:hypothetical protein
MWGSCLPVVGIALLLEPVAGELALRDSDLIRLESIVGGSAEKDWDSSIADQCSRYPV